jgi:hypothetical protein
MSPRTSQTLSRILVGVLIIFFSISKISQAEELTPQEALEKFAESIARVKSYDVTFQCKRSELKKTVVEEVNGKRVAHSMPLAESEIQAPKTTTYHQLCLNNESFRSEEFRPKTELLRLAITIHGDEMKTLEIGNGPLLPGAINERATIEKRPDDIGRALIKGGQPYASFFGNASSIVPIPKVLSGRKTLRHVADQSKPEQYVVECQPEKGASSLPDTGWRLTLDPLNGYLPSCIELYSQNMNRLTSRTEILDYKALPVGIAVPTKMKTTSFITSPGEFFGKPSQISEYTVDLEKSRWNCALDADAFDLQIPPGARVIDKTKQ